ncbi:MAG: hypothetical protein M3018_08345 [Actinomycetota bacterium]|nr:hypothetical protein [Actinomycetota bacterium]
MSSDQQRDDDPQSGDPDASDTTQQAGRGGEGANPAQAAPPISDSDQQAGQTERPAPDDDVGVPEEVERRTE